MKIHLLHPPNVVCILANTKHYLCTRKYRAQVKIDVDLPQLSQYLFRKQDPGSLTLALKGNLSHIVRN